MKPGDTSGAFPDPMATPIASDDAGGVAEVVDLSEVRFIGRGWKRDCYLHPDDATLCIKVSKDGPPRPGRSWRKRLMRWRLARDTGDVLNRREWEAYRRYGAILAAYVPRYHGFVPTSRGPGLAIDLVRERDGAPSPELGAWLARSSPEERDALLPRFRGLFDLLEREKIWLMDLNFRNFLVQDTGSGTARPWLIDLKRLADNKEVFQPAGWSERLRHRKLARRIERFEVKFRSGASR